ncbi:hypothetical protein HYE01_01125 [Mycoplasmopsis bovis]|nr:hypothetical protein HYE01_01125 [Mycoplasmopsis bovis]
MVIQHLIATKLKVQKFYNHQRAILQGSSSSATSNSESLKDKIIKRHLESASESTLKLFGGAHSSSNSKVLSPTEKENKAQKDREDKAVSANLISNDQRTKQSSEEDKKLVNGWTNSTSNRRYAPGRWPPCAC